MRGTSRCSHPTGKANLLPTTSTRVVIQSHGIAYLAVLCFPLLAGFFLHMGFYNFCYSIAIYFFLLGYWLRYWQMARAG